MTASLLVKKNFHYRNYKVVTETSEMVHTYLLRKLVSKYIVHASFFNCLQGFKSILLYANFSFLRSLEYSDDLLQLVFVRICIVSCVVWSASCRVRSHLNIFEFHLKVLYGPILFKNGIIHFRDKRNINCKTHDSCPTMTLKARQNLSNIDYLKKKSSKLLLHILKKNWIHVL